MAKMSKEAPLDRMAEAFVSRSSIRHEVHRAVKAGRRLGMPGAVLPS